MVIVFILFAIIISYIIVISPSIYLLPATIFLSFMIVTLIKPHIGTLILPYSMFFTPEILLGKVPEREITIRADDFMILGIFAGYFMRSTLKKIWPLKLDFPLSKEMALYTLAGFLSLILNTISRELNFKQSLLFFLKYTEYFVLYFLVLKTLTELRHIKIGVINHIIANIGVTIYAYYSGQFGRATMPFESATGPGAEPNTLGGYYVLVFGLLFGVLSYTKETSITLPVIALFAFNFFAFLMTYSRASYFATSFMLIPLLLFSPRRNFILGAVAGVFSLFILSAHTAGLKGRVYNRVLYTISGGGGEEFGVRFDPSTSQRIQAWKDCFTIWFPNKPVFGWGPAGTKFLDAQYPRILGEYGAFGFVAFLLLIYNLIKLKIKIIKETQDKMQKALSFGLIIAITGLLAQALGTNTFIIIRIMEPFWYIVALNFSLYKIKNA